MKEPVFFKNLQDGNRTYELYFEDDVEVAKAWLLTKKVEKPEYYITVKTRQGTWGIDKEGLYLTDLLDWQTDISLAQFEGSVTGIPSAFNLGIAERGVTDNFVVQVKCGKVGCNGLWHDALRYHNKTIVRCPKCSSYNVIDTNNIHYIEGGTNKEVNEASFEPLSAPKVSFQRYSGTGVCDVCNKSIGPGDAYLVPVDVFYSSRKYKEWLMHGPMSSFFQLTRGTIETYMATARARDSTSHSAVCSDDIHMFEGNNSATGQIATQSATSQQKTAIQPTITAWNKSPVLAAVLSFFLFGGAGQIYLGQWKKGLALIVATVLLNVFAIGILIGIIGVGDAYGVAKKLSAGNPVGEWEFKVNWKVVSLVVIIYAILTCAALYYLANRPTPAPTATSSPTLTSTPELTITTAPTKTLTPNPIVEEAHAFMDPILKTALDRLPDYQDDFSDPNSGWPVGRQPAKGHEEGVLGYENGEYFVTADEAKFPWESDSSKKISCLSAYPSPTVPVLDFVMEVDARFVTRTEDGDWQLKFWRESTFYYGVRMDQTGSVGFHSNFPFQETLDANDRWMTESVPSFDFKGGSNHLVVVAKDSQIAMTLNNSVVVFMDNFPRQERGAIGFVVCNFGASPFRAQWDNLKIWNLSE